MWANARRLERALFAHEFALGSRHDTAAEVAASVLAYRNSDGGFGHALEPDVRAPQSMALHTEIALRAFESARLRNAEVARGACHFLESIAEPSGRVPIILRSARDYPHADHWQYPSPPDSINPTGALVGLLLRQGIRHPWLERATDWCWERVEQPIGEAHELISALTFLEHAPGRERASRLAEKVVAQAPKARNYLADADSPDYGVTPLQLCPTPEWIGRPALPEHLVDAPLDRLVRTQQDDGGWPITWQAPSPASTYEWRGRWTLEALTTLRAYGRL